MPRERAPGEPLPEMRRLSQETVSLQDGPIDLMLASDHVRIVDSRRDMELVSADERDDSEIGCMVIHPLTFNPPDFGFKGLRDGEEIILGRKHHRNRFTFDVMVSGDHVKIRRRGTDIDIEDLGSTNGTYLVRKPKAGLLSTLKTTGRRALRSLTVPAVEASSTPIFRMVGESIASAAHPDSNEDAFYLDEDYGSAGVFDGISTHKGSEEAANIAAVSVQEFLKKIPKNTPYSLAELAVREALEKAHTAIKHRNTELIINGQINHERPLGTTAIVAKLLESENGQPYAIIGGAGDSRAYLIRNSRIEGVTLDHVFTVLDTEHRQKVQETLAQATDITKLSHDDYVRFDKRNYIDSSLGSDDNPTIISVTHFNLQAGDQILLTSDGIHDNLTSSEIEETISGNEPDVAVRDLIVAAQARSKDSSHDRAKTDDMTAVILSYE